MWIVKIIIIYQSAFTDIFQTNKQYLLELKPAVAGAAVPLLVGGDFKRVASPVNQNIIYNSIIYCSKSILKSPVISKHYLLVPR